MSHEQRLTRRRVLQASGSTLGAAALVGTAGAAPEGSGRINVGYSSASGRRAAEAAADEVVYRYNFDALSIVAPDEVVSSLAGRSDIRYVERDEPMYAIATLDSPLAATTDHGDDGGDDNGDEHRDENGEDGGDNGDENRNENGDTDDGGSDGGDDTQTCQTGDQPLPWGIDRVDADVAHEHCSTGGDVDVAIIDTGIDQYHSDLQPNLGTGQGFVGGQQTGNWQDDNGHGTHCAGIADAVDDADGVVGVSTTATLHAVKVLQAPGTGLTSDVAAGIEYAADQGWDVASLSLGGGQTQALQDAVQYADSKGVVIVAAAGNDGPCTDCVGYPAAYEEAIAVSSTNQSDGFSSFSSQGPEVDIAAPGSSIYSSYTGSTPATDTYNTLSGTSMACPHVSGAAAQLLAAGYTPAEVRDRLTATAEDIGLAANESGAGLLDVAAALGLDSSDDGFGTRGGGGPV